MRTYRQHVTYWTIAILTLVFWSSIGICDPGLPRGLPEFQCAGEVQRALGAYQIKSSFRRQAPSREGDPFRAPTSTFGKWVELVVRKGLPPVLYVSTNQTTERIAFDSRCKSSSQIQPGMDFGAGRKDAKFFSDSDLEKYIKSHKNAMIYLWSPGLAFSISYFNKFKKVASQLKIDFLPLVDNNAATAAVDSVSKLHSLPRSQSRLNSVELYMRNMAVHYPSAILVLNHKLVEPLLIGAMDEAYLKHKIETAISRQKAKP